MCLSADFKCVVFVDTERYVNSLSGTTTLVRNSMRQPKVDDSGYVCIHVKQM